MVKRMLDIVGALLLLILLVPFLIVIGVYIRLDSSGNILYCQERVGRNGIFFKIFKFRTMISNADQVGGYSTAVGDLRITKAGALLRKTSLDELPQIINVLLGDMSLVGPRPDVPAQREIYSSENWHKRNSVRPGITGLAQATVRSAASPGERTRLDLEYVDKQSLFFDFKIMFLTVKQVLGKGGY